MSVKQKNSSMQELFRIRTIKVLRGNFSAVDLGEEPCHNSLSEKGKYGGKGETTERRAAEEQGDFASGSAQNALSAAACFVTILSVVKFFEVCVLGKLKA